MRGEFYTERDIQDLLNSGVRELALKEEDRITDLGREQAAKGGMRIIYPTEGGEAAPHRYPPVAAPRATASQGGAARAKEADLRDRVRSSVIAKVGSEVDPDLIDDVISRVFRQLGID